MTKPLLASKPMRDKKQSVRMSMASFWHGCVFRAHGDRCYFCGQRAVDAMHLIPRSKLGPLRYEMPVENGRPGCRDCHQLQEQGVLAFDTVDLHAAIEAHNKIAKVPIRVEGMTVKLRERV